MTTAPPVTATAQERALARGWTPAGLARLLRDKAMTMGGLDPRGEKRNNLIGGGFRYREFRWCPAPLKAEILERLDRGEWDHLQSDWNALAEFARSRTARDVPGHGTEPDTKGTGMKLEETYGTGKFIKATSDGTIGLPGTTDFPETFVGTIKKMGDATFDDGSKQRVIYFEELPQENGKDKGLGLNVTNWRTIAQFTGKNDDDGWVGERVELYVVPESKAESGFSIRVKKPRAGAVNAPAAAPVEALGVEWAKKLVERVKLEAEKVGVEKANAAALRTFLVASHPNLAGVLAGPPNGWPKTVEADVDNWIAGLDLPF